MIHHIALTAGNLGQSAQFYEAILVALGYVRTLDVDGLIAWEGPNPEILLYAAKEEQSQNLHKTYDPGVHHLCFRVPDRATVDEIARIARSAGGRLLDAPRPYPDYAPNYYAAYFEDPDGIKLEVMTS